MMNKRTIIIIVIVVLVILAVVYRNQITAFFTGTRTLRGGSPPTADDESCNNVTQRTGTGRIVQACTKPLYRKVGTARERAWTMETDDYPFDTCQGGGTTIKTEDGTKWWFNYQSGAKCIYISDNRFPFITNLRIDPSKPISGADDCRLRGGVWNNATGTCSFS